MEVTGNFRKCPSPCSGQEPCAYCDGDYDDGTRKMTMTMLEVVAFGVGGQCRVKVGNFLVVA